MANSRLVRRLSWIGIGLSLAGLVVSIYLALDHYQTGITLACSEQGVVNCAKVTSSSYSIVYGIPLPLLGIGFFIAMLVASLPAMWRSRSRFIRFGRVALALSGIAMVFWLVYVELFYVNAICLWCSVVHLISLGLFALTAIGTTLTAPRANTPDEATGR